MVLDNLVYDGILKIEVVKAAGAKCDLKKTKLVIRHCTIGSANQLADSEATTFGLVLGEGLDYALIDHSILGPIHSTSNDASKTTKVQIKDSIVMARDARCLPAGRCVLPPSSISIHCLLYTSPSPRD